MKVWVGIISSLIEMSKHKGKKGRKETQRHREIERKRNELQWYQMSNTLSLLIPLKTKIILHIIILIFTDDKTEI